MNNFLEMLIPTISHFSQVQGACPPYNRCDPPTPAFSLKIKAPHPSRAGGALLHHTAHSVTLSISTKDTRTDADVCTRGRIRRAQLKGHDTTMPQPDHNTNTSNSAESPTYYTLTDIGAAQVKIAVLKAALDDLLTDWWMCDTTNRLEIAAQIDDTIQAINALRESL